MGSLNLAEFVKEGQFDFYSFESAVEIATEGLNEVLLEGMPMHPLQEQRDSVDKWRQIGLGIFGLADMLIKLGIRYGSQESIDLCDKIGSSMIQVSVFASSILADQEKYMCEGILDSDVTKSDFFKFNVTDQGLEEQVMNCSLANSQLLTIAPTGTLSTMLGVSGGIEPIFANFYERKTESLHGKDVYYKVYTPIVKKYMEDHNLDESSELPFYFVTAADIHYTERIAMQGIWQSHIDASISSTVNLPNEATIEDIEKLYIEAWKWGLKGITIFRDGCNRAAILTTKKEEEIKEEPPAPKLKWGETLKVSDDVIGKKRKLTTGCGSLHCQAFFDPGTGRLLETYLSKGSTGGCNNFMIGLSRMISLAARSGCSIEKIVDQLSSAGSCSSYAVRKATKGDTSKGACCPIAVGYALMEMWKEVQRELAEKAEFSNKKTQVPIKISTSIPTSVKNEVFLPIVDKTALCPECGEEITFEGGCNICKNCGWSRCS